MFDQTSLTANFTSTIPAKRFRSYSQDSTTATTATDSTHFADSTKSSIGEFEIPYCDNDGEDDGIIILLDPSQLDVERQFVFEMCNISTV
ncbi:hypothetical protein PHYBLDRAFT_139611 [Phycomyces blakesleeanus NRRL 1555(-)]|uniref:Uncharacterized protein n=1 Tax=Phycomyces blakesleeanus (strain ATCC 8743b / DSM 1359 / FGSC 10004 / NBRC 33097 / NRRL 1555) TaxID=763407 RepID=A0A162V2U5_PHYB8|nr:hypothetical protein PHYBLDRAFT_139611 [Phycomyces blakesleeanus NRRL 1555(-)]OAD79582.1 hypothetical protein PHYBLDRAFT_139611 [Phycomyces blakesleeanus NRRL 1555(-)]|eukprot:XP_018297622.1 hypothetical protein PHYBLDRAFT_139611 [Phycomyces blakesleeanus NRRL 1555(-)]